MKDTDHNTHDRHEGGTGEKMSSYTVPQPVEPDGEHTITRAPTASSPGDRRAEYEAPVDRDEALDDEPINWLSMLTDIVSGGGSGQTPEERQRKRRANVPGRIAAVILSVGISVGIILMRDRLTDLSLYGYPGIFLINLVGNATIILPAPAFAAVFAAGGALNPIFLGVFAGLGSALGEMTGYLAGIGGRSVIENRKLYDRLEAWMRKVGMFAIFLMAVIPNPVFDVGGMVAGALRMPVPRFLLACWAGKTVRMILIALIGQMLIAP